MKLKSWCGIEVCMQNAERLKATAKEVIDNLECEHPEWATLPLRKIPDTPDGTLFCEAISFAFM